MKREIRVMGIDDGPFDKRVRKPVLVVGTIFRGGDWLDGVVSTYVEQDGYDATEKIAEMINKSKFVSQLRCIFLNGIAVAGFNVIDVLLLAKKTKKAVVVVVREYPDFEKIFAALKKMKQEDKINIIKTFPLLHKIGNVYVQAVGYSTEEVRKIMKIVCTRANVPEPLRASHLIAAGVVTGESRGRA